MANKDRKIENIVYYFRSEYCDLQQPLSQVSGQSVTFIMRPPRSPNVRGVAPGRGNAGHICGVYFEYLGGICGVCLGYLWYMFGVFVRYVWDIFGILLVYFWDIL